MNLNLYDNIEIDKNKTWVDPAYKKLYSKEMERYAMFTVLKRYNPKDRCFDYFLALSNTGDKEHHWDCVTLTRSGIVKINLARYWHLLPFTKCAEFNVIIEEVEHDEDGIIYYLDI